MKILELNISNYKGFREQTRFSFSEHFTVIAGVNGRGKTTILDALALLFSHLIPQISEASFQQRRINKSEINIGGREAILSINANCAGIPIQYSVKVEPTRTSPITRLQEVVANEIKSAYGNPFRSDDQAPLAVYYTIDRAGYRFPKTLPQVERSGQAMAYSGALLNNLVDYQDFMSRYRVSIALTYDRETRNTSYMGDNVVRAINNAIEYFLDGFSRLEVKERPLRFLVTKNSEELDLRQLSDGERALIAMICDLGRRLALANPSLQNPLEGSGVVLIDELELHLHPKWQMEIAEKLRRAFPNIQFIVTTHSPFIIQTARQGEVIKLDGDLDVDPYGKSLEEIAKFVMEVENTEYSPRIKNMREIARSYFRLVEEARTADNRRKEEIKNAIIRLLEPFSDNPAYTALLESKGLI
ncbi:MAG: AAA family ATPase [Saprospiraceae bacterium]|nr:AAA family ATPase [Saprospiraceae bacterium]